MASLLCGLARYSLHYSHWTDIVAGYVVGIVIAIYIVSPFAQLYWSKQQSYSINRTVLGERKPLPAPKFQPKGSGIPIQISELNWIRISSRSLTKCCGFITLSASVILPSFVTRGQSNLTKSASRGIPQLEVTPGGRKLYHWIPGAAFLLVFHSNYRPRMHSLATVHARDNQPTTNDVTTQPTSISASFTNVKWGA